MIPNSLIRFVCSRCHRELERATGEYVVGYPETLVCATCVLQAISAAARNADIVQGWIERAHDRHSEPVVACGKCRAGVRG